MTLLSLATFFITMLIIVAVPGPGTFAITSKALTHKISHVSFMILGMVIADIIFLLFAIFGLNAIASILGELFVVVKYVGALYLIYLGYKLLSSKAEHQELESDRSESWLKNLLIGFVITFSNPKVVLFYLSLLPTLIDIKHIGVVDIGLLMLLVSIIISLVMFSYAWIALRAKKALQKDHIKDKMNKVAGGVMITAGGLLAVKA